MKSNSNCFFRLKYCCKEPGAVEKLMEVPSSKDVKPVNRELASVEIW
ncbi:hypothetical protein DCCM_1060 [Desulfocucumis palustris]|uniref:Uncharacterized protein n=1 Tax=Desulfocucumis palustris TaxID=1898651 RepID=A0A2L2XA81_9FIRM|nr:hypothetical protein DCCM_1060 [Desulfocucumis palustris]